MNYITSCPNCGTQFLLNETLIKAYRGKVQCGNCEHVFNAKNRLTEVPDDITSADEFEGELDNSASFQETISAPVEDVIPIELFTESEPDNQTQPEPAVQPTPELTVDSGIANRQEPTIDATTATVADDFSSHITTGKPQPKTSPWLWLGSLLLLLFAFLQSIYFNRVQVAAEYPQYKPLLLNICSTLGCKIDLPKNLDLITIGDSDMQEDDSYQSVINFTSSLKNKAKYAQAFPDIELTLTDTDDRTVIKKRIQPKEYLGSEEKIKQGLPGLETETIKLSLFVDESVVAGYRILLTY